MNKLILIQKKDLEKLIQECIIGECNYRKVLVDKKNKERISFVVSDVVEKLEGDTKLIKDLTTPNK